MEIEEETGRVLSRRATLAGGVAAAALAVVPMGIDRAAATPLPSNNAPPNTNTFYPEDYGAVGNGTTDDTAAIQTCIDVATYVGGGTVQFGPKTYLVNSNPRTDRGGNAVLALPYSALAQTKIKLRGVPQRTEIKTTLTGKSYSSSYGCPSVVGGPTPESLGTGGSVFSLCSAEIEDLNVIVPANPSICGIDLSRMVRASAKNLFISSVDPTTAAPNKVYTFGLRMPDGLNYGRQTVDLVDVYGFYTGFVVNTAHLAIGYALAKWNIVAFGFTGSGEYNNPDPHMASIDDMVTEHCCFHISGWSPGGVRAITGPFHAIVQAWDIEDAPIDHTPRYWYMSWSHLFDNFNKLFGHINYMRVRGDTGEMAGLYVVGGSNVGLGDLTTTGGLDLARGAGDPHRLAPIGAGPIPGLLDAEPEELSTPPLTERQYQTRTDTQARGPAEKKTRSKFD